ncbi:MAG: dUTP diphosphatase [Coriobacteriales bacterium]|jgi:dUTP pyrophosphatase|nr:dUTP diphosphatase [Coriobacteriales bacterium]
MNTITLAIKRLDKRTPMPAYAHVGDAGLDLTAAENLTIAPGERRLIPTGIAVAIPEGYAGFVQPRSGLAIKQGMSIVNTPGLIDSSYRGEIKVIAINTDQHDTIDVHAGDRIAQLVILQVPKVSIKEVDTLSETERGQGGFGSSGV